MFKKYRTPWGAAAKALTIGVVEVFSEYSSYCRTPGAAKVLIPGFFESRENLGVFYRNKKTMGYCLIIIGMQSFIERIKFLFSFSG